MEPADLNSPSEDRRLAGLLQQTSTPIPDDGFSDRVLSALPPPDVAGLRLLPFVAVLTGAVLGLVYARWHGATAAALQAAGREFDTFSQRCAPLLDNPWVWLAGTAILASCYSALRLSGLSRSPFRR